MVIDKLQLNESEHSTLLAVVMNELCVLSRKKEDLAKSMVKDLLSIFDKLVECLGDD